MDIRSEVHKLANQYLKKVKRSGPDDIMAICPFHLKPDGTEERTPSFAMSLSKGLYFCHSCHNKGNLFTFLRDIGIPRESIERQYRFLIDQASSNLPPPPDPLRVDVWDLPPIEERLLGLFDYCPVSLLEDGFTQETLYRFEVGYDHLHKRITFPLRDLKGTLVGISGRATTKYQDIRYKVYTEEYKAWNLPARPEPNKRSLLWNGHRVYPEVYLKNPGETSVVVVEGFKAAMWVYQAGFPNVVALLGSYLSWEHQWILERIGSTVVMFLDNNRAGRVGTVNAAERLSRSLNVHVVEYPARLEDDENLQPDSCDPEEVMEALRTAPTYLNWLLKFAEQVH